jgi:hypothetical protein
VKTCRWLGDWTWLSDGAKYTNSMGIWWFAMYGVCIISICIYTLNKYICIYIYQSPPLWAIDNWWFMDVYGMVHMFDSV